eukprot:177733_1
MTGKDFAGCNNTQDIMEDFSVEASTAGKLFFELKSLKGNISNVADDPPPYSPPEKDDQKETARVEFYEGQRIDANDGGWHDGIIKQVGVNQYGQRCVRVGWLLDKWADKRYDKLWAEHEW